MLKSYNVVSDNTGLSSFV